MANSSKPVGTPCVCRALSQDPNVKYPMVWGCPFHGNMAHGTTSGWLTTAQKEAGVWSVEGAKFEDYPARCVPQAPDSLVVRTKHYTASAYYKAIANMCGNNRHILGLEKEPSCVNCKRPS